MHVKFYKRIKIIKFEINNLKVSVVIPEVEFVIFKVI